MSPRSVRGVVSKKKKKRMEGSQLQRLTSDLQMHLHIYAHTHPHTLYTPIHKRIDSKLHCAICSPLFPGEARACRGFDVREEGKLTLCFGLTSTAGEDTLV